MKKLDNKELREIIQSGHINLLIGSGCSLDYLSTLKDIEERMNVEETREVAQKDYYKLIKKSKAILNEDLETDGDEKKKLHKTKENYDSFLGFWADIISRRSLHIVNKQVNIFTTNFDMFMEVSCERLGIPYNDGFAGQISPTFNVANFNKIQKYKSLQFDNTSDIPLFNIVKLHGSASWIAKDEKIIYSDGSHIPDNLDDKTGSDFNDGYSKIAIINPNAEKHFETVLDTNYASMLRKFTLELEKENSVLIIIGFSLADKHIKNLLYGVMKSNPTLIVIYFSYSQYDGKIDKLEERKNPNLYIAFPEITTATFNNAFGEGQEKKWEKFVKDKDAGNLIFIDGIKSEIDKLPETNVEEKEFKDKLLDIVTFSFHKSAKYLSDIFVNMENNVQYKDGK